MVRRTTSPWLIALLDRSALNMRCLLVVRVYDVRSHSQVSTIKRSSVQLCDYKSWSVLRDLIAGSKARPSTHHYGRLRSRRLLEMHGGRLLVLFKVDGFDSR